MKNSGEGAADLAGSLLECIEDPWKCGIDTVTGIVELVTMLDELGELIDKLVEGLSELVGLPQETKEKIICNMIGEAILESGFGVALASALPKLTKKIIRKLELLKKIAKSKLKLTPDLLDIVSTLSEKDLRKIEIIQRMAKRDTDPTSLSKTNRKLESSLRSCNIR